MEDKQEPVAAGTVWDDQLQLINKFKYLGKFIIAGEG